VRTVIGNQRHCRQPERKNESAITLGARDHKGKATDVLVLPRNGIQSPLDAERRGLNHVEQVDQLFATPTAVADDRHVDELKEWPFLNICVGRPTQEGLRFEHGRLRVDFASRWTMEMPCRCDEMGVTKKPLTGMNHKGPEVAGTW